MEPTICDKCNAPLEVGMYPFCKGDPANHGKVIGAAQNNVFPFTVNHVDGKPMVIESMQHLRKVERERGVVFSAFSKSNINDLDPIRDLPKYRDYNDR